jgi:hypothetical protein
MRTTVKHTDSTIEGNFAFKPRRKSKKLNTEESTTQEKTTFKFVDEVPATKRGSGSREAKYMDVAEALRNNPDQTVLLDERVNTSFASAVNKGKLKAFRPEGDFLATTRNSDEDGKVDCYIRYVGPAIEDIPAEMEGWGN